MVVDFGVEVFDASGEGPQGGSGAALLDRHVGAVTEPGACGDLLGGVQPAQPRTDRFVGGDDDRFETR